MFQISDRGSTVWRELLGGATTFMAMSYILFVQVGLLGGIGMDAHGVLMATCISAAAASVIMGLWANYPIALAPGMGENFFFALTIAPAMAATGLGVGWQMALALTAVSGVVFLALSLVGLRSRILNAIPDALKSGIAAGIGLFIAVIGFGYANLVAVSRAPDATFGRTVLMLPGLRDNPVAWLALAGLAITLTLTAFRVRGSLLIGILLTFAGALAMDRWGGTHMVSWSGQVLAVPGGLSKTAGAFWPGLTACWNALFTQHAVQVVSFTFILLFMVMFDTVGTLVGVSARAGLMRQGTLPNAERALAADATGTTIGAMLGSSTVTAYIESVTGVQAGARTGLAAVVAGVLLLAAMFFSPLIQAIAGGTQIAPGVFKYPVIAPALIVVGAMMMRTLRDIDWDDVTEYLPAFLTVLSMTLHFSIADGIAMGFVSYAAAKLLSGRVRECPVIVYVFAALFVVEYVWAM